MLSLTGRQFDLVMSEIIRRPSPDKSVYWPILIRESLAIWFNAGRIVVYQAGGILGIPAETRSGWLR